MYFLFSGACLLAYRWAGMSWADAFMHMCTTMGLGGFSSYDASFGHFNSPMVEWVAIVFMTLAGISFVRYFVVLRSRSIAPISNDREIRTYLAVLLVATFLVMALLLAHGVYDDGMEALRISAFHVVSLATTTGYAATDYTQWPVFAPILLMFWAALQRVRAPRVAASRWCAWSCWLSKPGASWFASSTPVSSTRSR